MEFIKTLKKREYIEMTLKALTALIFAFIAIILMEGMIYSIYLNAYKTNGTKSTLIDKNSVIYCIEDGRDEITNEPTYFVLIYNGSNGSNEGHWAADASSRYTKNSIETTITNKTKNVVWHAPSAFEFTITPTHFIVISVFVLIIAGFFTFRFIRLAKTYKEIETTYEKTGTIELGK